MKILKTNTRKNRIIKELRERNADLLLENIIVTEKNRVIKYKEVEEGTELRRELMKAKREITYLRGEVSECEVYKRQVSNKRDEVYNLKLKLDGANEEMKILRERLVNLSASVKILKSETK